MSINHVSYTDFELHVSAVGGFTEKCNNILNHRGKVDNMDNSGWTPLMYAARNGHQHIVRLLHENGADIKISNKYGYTPLSLAVTSGNEATIKYILETMNNNLKNLLKEDLTSFGLACFLGRTSFVKMYLSLNIFNVNDPVLFGMAPLLLAASNGKVETAKVLLSAGANKFATNSQLQTSYDIAVYRKDTKLQALLCDNKFCNSPLLPLTPLNNRLSLSPSLHFSVLNNSRRKIYYSTSDCDDLENSGGKLKFSENSQCLKERKLYEKDQEHSYCTCHYLNSLLSPRIHYKDILEWKRKKYIPSTEQCLKHKKLKHITVKKDIRWLPWVKKKLNKRHSRSNHQSNKNTNNKEYRLKENLKITKLLTILQLEEYISTFIIQEIDADTIPTLTEEDLVNIGIDEKKLDEILLKLSMFNFSFREEKF